MKEYHSFEEIDRDLKILKLQNEIDKEEIKLNMRRTKEGISPKYLFKSAAKAIKKKALELTAVAKGFGNGVINS